MTTLVREPFDSVATESVSRDTVRDPCERVARPSVTVPADMFPENVPVFAPRTLPFDTVAVPSVKKDEDNARMEVRDPPERDAVPSEKTALVADFKRFNVPLVKEPVPSVSVDADTSVARVREPPVMDAEPSDSDEETREVRAVKEPRVRDEVPSERVEATTPTEETNLALVREPPDKVAVESEIDDAEYDLSPRRAPLAIVIVPSVRVEEVTLFKRLSTPPASDAVPSVCVFALRLTNPVKDPCFNVAEPSVSVRAVKLPEKDPLTARDTFPLEIVTVPSVMTLEDTVLEKVAEYKDVSEPPDRVAIPSLMKFAVTPPVKVPLPAFKFPPVNAAIPSVRDSAIKKLENDALTADVSEP